jgi:hypothetical protein
MLSGCAFDIQAIINWVGDVISTVPEPTPTPTPSPDPPPIPEPTPTPVPITKHLIVLDLDAQPNEMRAAGFVGRDTMLWYMSNCTVYPGYGIDTNAVLSDPTGVVLYNQQPAIIKWMDDKVRLVVDELKSNPAADATVILNDGADKCGNRVGEALINKMTELKAPMDRVKPGVILPEPQG